MTENSHVVVLPAVLQGVQESPLCLRLLHGSVIKVL
jgi:hypothetical protein